MRAAVAQALDASRLLLAGKAALAAGIAWYFAPLIPLADDSYSYYAPLGVLVSMYPTLAGSARSGLQALLGLAFGIGAGIGALALVRAGAPGLVGVSLVVGVGVLVGGIRALGAGRDWIAIAGLIVLLIGDADTGGFSLTYLVTMAFGAVVGVIVNLVIVPPLHLRYAGDRLSQLRDEIVSQLGEMADAVESGSLDEASLAREMSHLADMAASVAEDVSEGDLSKRGNPRGVRHAEEQRENARRFRAIERIAFFTRDLADVLARMQERASPLLATDHRDDLAEAIRATADFIAQPIGDPRAAAAGDAADRVLTDYASSLAIRLEEHPADAATDLTAVESLRRILDAARPFA